MAQIPLGTRFIGISEEVDLRERGSSMMNRMQEPYTMQDIIDSVPLGAPEQVTSSANGTTISTTTVLTANSVNIIDTAASLNRAVKLADPVFGSVTHVVNTSGIDIYVFPNDSTGSIYGYAAGEYVIVPSDGLMYTFTCVQNPAVGVWTFTTPAIGNTATATVEYDITLTTDSSATGTNQLTDGFIGATQIVISNIPYVCAVSVPNMADALLLMDPLFNNYNEIRPVLFELYSNIPTGDLNDANGQNPADVMGIANPSALDTVGCSLGAATKDFSASCASFAGPAGQATFSGSFNSTYIMLQGFGLSITPYISLPGYPGTTGQTYQKNTIDLSLSPFEPLFDANGYFAKYFMLAAYAGNNSYPQHSSFPNGTVFEMKAKVTFELKK